MTSSGLSKTDEDLWLQAEDIFQRCKREEFDLSPEGGSIKMSQTLTRQEERKWLGGTKEKKQVKTVTLRDAFMEAITA